MPHSLVQAVQHGRPGIFIHLRFANRISLEELPMLKPQDVLVLLRLAGEPGSWSYQQLASELGLSASEVHQALKRAAASGLYDAGKRLVQTRALLEFARHGLRYVYPVKRLARCHGVPTAHCVPPLAEHLAVEADDWLVWPHPDGECFGDAIEPLYRSAPAAAARNPRLHRRLALIDAIRAGRSRERELAGRMLEAELAW
jgi:DNA-binding Lrp family transcriptional regulator